jgi:coiled-coil domain-containing protein 130
MKHSACGGWWEIRTDPEKSEYTVVEGARRRDYGPENKGSEADGDLKFLTEEEREKRREDAFANLEGKMEEKTNDKKNKERVEELYDKSEVWRDPYEANARLRKDFRAKRKVWKREERHKEGMQDKFSLGIDIADETDTDRLRAGLIDFGTKATTERLLEDASWRPLFADKEDTTKALQPLTSSKRLKSEMMAEKSKKDLQQTLVGNSRASIDPFLGKNGFVPPKVNLGLLKRKRNTTKDASAVRSETMSTTADQLPSKKSSALSLALVGYDSD